MEMRPGMDFRDGGGVIENLGDGSNSIIIGTDLIERFDSSDNLHGIGLLDSLIRAAQFGI